jgi:alanine racemase
MPTWVEIDLSAIKVNAQAIKRHTRCDALIAVIKADAYGHGAVPVARALDKEALMYAVAAVDEAIELREAGITKPILILFNPLPEQAETVARYQLTPSVCEPTLCQALSRAAKASGVRVRVHVDVNTGMNRDGVWHENAVDFVKWLRDLEGIEIEGIYTHFAMADEPDVTHTSLQLARFNAVLSRLADLDLRPPIVHAANSAAALMLPQTHFDAVRVGLSLYGVYPARHIALQSAARLCPALVWKARVIWLHDAPSGESVSYGGAYKTNATTRLATLSIGYADGYPWALSNRGEAFIGGGRCPLVGRVCMDAAAFRLPQSLNVAIGDEAILIGEGISVDEVAEKAGTISYEILTGIGKRAQRVYTSEN